MKIGVMQPYFLPYLGYFALINAVDKFVFLDDVQYIRRQGKGKGWINRNRVRVGAEWRYITLPIKRAALSANINEVFIADDEKSIEKLKKTIEYTYLKAPYFNTIKELIFDLIIPSEKICTLNINLINRICAYLEIDTKIYISSEIEKDISLSGEKRIINLCKLLEGTQYINAIGGVDLYSKKEFLDHEITLSFLKLNELSYYQGTQDFLPNLSIIDPLMWNSIGNLKKMLQSYTLLDGK